jgi:hypothetical protein
MTAHQPAFATALLAPDCVCPSGLKSWNGSDPGRRFAVYRNNVIVGLVDALADSYPVVQALVGEDFFRAMAGVFVRAQPPRSPVLAWYGAGLAEFIAGFPPAAGLPYLADVARLEWLRVEAWHAADAVSMPMDELAAVLADAQALPEARVVLHPALRVLRSTHPIVSLWAAHQTDDPGSAVAAVDLGMAEAALLLRPALDVDIVRVEWPVADFVARLQEGVALGAAVDAGEAFDLPETLGLLIHSGAIVRITTTRSSS